LNIIITVRFNSPTFATAAKVAAASVGLCCRRRLRWSPPVAAGRHCRQGGRHQRWLRWSPPVAAAAAASAGRLRRRQGLRCLLGEFNRM